MEINQKALRRGQCCLNPYYNGRYSWRNAFNAFYKDCYVVLILIIMEDAHGAL